MKKGPFLFLLVFVAFVCVMIGILIGRCTSPSNLTVSDSNISQAEFDETHSNTTSSLGKINVNTASADDFASLPGIGETIAQRIIDYRTKYGSFTSIEELKQVDGIGDKRLDGIREFITVGG